MPTQGSQIARLTNIGASSPVHHARFRTREQARTALFDYIEVFYNRQRLHSGIGYRTPAEARIAMTAAAQGTPRMAA